MIIKTVGELKTFLKEKDDNIAVFSLADETGIEILHVSEYKIDRENTSEYWMNKNIKVGDTVITLSPFDE